MGPCFKCKFHVRLDGNSFCKKELSTPKYIKTTSDITGRSRKIFNENAHGDCTYIRSVIKICTKFQKEVWYKRFW